MIRIVVFFLIVIFFSLSCTVDLDLVPDGQPSIRDLKVNELEEEDMYSEAHYFVDLAEQESYTVSFLSKTRLRFDFHIYDEFYSEVLSNRNVARVNFSFTPEFTGKYKIVLEKLGKINGNELRDPNDFLLRVREKINVSEIVAISDDVCAIIDRGVKCMSYYGTTESTTHQYMPGLSSGVTQISGGYLHICAIVNGGVKCWGRNTWGQLGNGSYTYSEDMPVDVIGLSSGVTQIEAGYDRTCAVVNGTVKCWGKWLKEPPPLKYSAIGLVSSAIPIVMPGLSSGATQVSISDRHLCAVVNGGVKCWGSNGYGQLGNGPNSLDSYDSTAVDVTGLSSGVTQITTGPHHTCAIQNGSVKCWGRGGGKLVPHRGDRKIYVSSAESSIPVDVPESEGAIHITSYEPPSVGCEKTFVVTQESFKVLDCFSYAPHSDEVLPGVIMESLSPGTTYISSTSENTCVIHNDVPKCWGSGVRRQDTSRDAKKRLLPRTLGPFNSVF